MRLVSAHVEKQRSTPLSILASPEGIVGPRAQRFTLERRDKGPKSALQAPRFACTIPGGVSPGLQHCPTGATHPEHESLGRFRCQLTPQICEIAPQHECGGASICHKEFRCHAGLLRPLDVLRKLPQDLAGDPHVKVLKGAEVCLLDVLAPFGYRLPVVKRDRYVVMRPEGKAHEACFREACIVLF